MTKRNLQLIMIALTFIPIVTGLLAMMGMHDPLYAGLGIELPHNATLDSNLRFLGGVWLGLGLAAAWT